MICPHCGKDHDRVIDSRSGEDGQAIRRRRECVACKRRFTTYERVEQDGLRVIKKDGSRVPFQRERLKRGLERACWKRPVTNSQIEEIVVSIQDHIEAVAETEVPSHLLGELAIRHLRRLDEVAYVRFASVYREFKDVQDFIDELRPMLNEDLH